MVNLQSANVDTNAPPRRWPFFLLGVALFVLGPALYLMQIRLKNLSMPWYLPVLATFGVLLMFISVRQRRGVIRAAALVLFALLCGLEWFILLVGTKAPLYTGPAQPGAKVPAFAATLADGHSFTNKDLETGVPTMLLFYRGRW